VDETATADARGGVLVSIAALRRELALRGLSQADLAVAANVSPTTITAIMKGRRVAPRVVRKISKALDAEPVSETARALLPEVA
jgi:transcriptional regulator with XRE-family HTH domain